jgi:hypothetical protein
VPVDDGPVENALVAFVHEDIAPWPRDHDLVRCTEVQAERFGALDDAGCVSCAKPITAARLEVLPAAPLCMPCHFNEQNCQSRGVEDRRA